MSPKSDLSLNYQDVLEKIRLAAASYKLPANITLIAVSKKQSVDAIEKLYRLGHRDFGENYVQELIIKAQELGKRGCQNIRWHFIGHLQTNKVKALMPWVTCIHTLDSHKLAKELAAKWVQTGRTGRLPVFVEVNMDQEETKSGVSMGEAGDLCQKLVQFPQLELLGLMCVPPLGTDPAHHFRALAALGERLKPYSQGMLSMGMSGDYASALAEGATHIRLGTVLFGPRIA